MTCNVLMLSLNATHSHIHFRQGRQHYISEVICVDSSGRNITFVAWNCFVGSARALLCEVMFLVPGSSRVKDALGNMIPPAPPVLRSLFNLVPADDRFPELLLDDSLPVLSWSTWPPETLGFPCESLSWDPVTDNPCVNDVQVKWCDFH